MKLLNWSMLLARGKLRLHLTLVMVEKNQQVLSSTFPIDVKGGKPWEPISQTYLFRSGRYE